MRGQEFAAAGFPDRGGDLASRVAKWLRAAPANRVMLSALFPPQYTIGAPGGAPGKPFVFSTNAADPSVFLLCEEAQDILDSDEALQQRSGGSRGDREKWDATCPRLVSDGLARFWVTFAPDKVAPVLGDWDVVSVEAFQWRRDCFRCVPPLPPPAPPLTSPPPLPTASDVPFHFRHAGMAWSST